MNNKRSKNKILNLIGKGMALLGALLGIFHLIKINGSIQFLLIGVGVFLIIISNIREND